MPQSTLNSHQKNRDKAIKINALSGNFFTKIINGRGHISHFEIARQFGLHPIAVCNALDDFATQDGQHDTVHREGFLRWADDTAFYALVSDLNLPEYLSQAVLASLGHFRDMSEVAA